MEWIEVRGTMNSKCPKCGYHIQTEDVPDTPYCPRCLYGKPPTFNLDVDFFENHKVKALAETPDGQLKIIVWLKLLAYAGKLNDEGRIYEHKGETLNRGFLSRLCGVTETQIAEFLKEYKRLRMIRFDTDKTMRLVNWSKYQNATSFCCEKETLSPKPPYKEKVRIKDNDLISFKDEKEVDNNNKSIIHRKLRIEIIDYLNKVLGTDYKYNSDYITKILNARITEGYTLEDFKKVIDSQYKEWFDTDMKKYLRPQTLFSTKFSSYLEYAKLKQNDKSKSFDFEEFVEAAYTRKWD